MSFALRQSVNGSIIATMVVLSVALNVGPGDLIRLAAGDLVPADAALVEARDLHLQEAALTGESLPVEKSVVADDTSDRRIFLGTSVVSGSATAIVDRHRLGNCIGDVVSRLTLTAGQMTLAACIDGSGKLSETVRRLPLAVTTVVVAAGGVVLPYTPLAAPLGFRPLPASYLLFLAALTAAYLAIVDAVKRRLMRRLVA